MKVIRKHQKSKLIKTTLQAIIAVGLLGVFTPVMAEIFTPATAKMPSRASSSKVQNPPSSIKQRSPIKDASARLATPCPGSIEGKLLGEVAGRNYGLQVGITLSGRTESGASVRNRVISGRDGFYKFEHLCAGNYTVNPDLNNRQEIESKNHSFRVPGASLQVRSVGDRKTRQNILSHALENQAISVTFMEKTRDRDIPYANASLAMRHMNKYSPTTIYKTDRSSTNGAGKANFNVTCCGLYKSQLEINSLPADWVLNDPTTTLTLQNPQPNGATQKLFFKRKMPIPFLTSGMSQSDILAAVNSAGFVRPHLTTRPTSDLNLDNHFAGLVNAMPKATYDERIRIAIYQISDQGLADQFKGRDYETAREQIRRSGMELNVTKIVPARARSGNGNYCTNDGSDRTHNNGHTRRGGIVSIKRSHSRRGGKTVIMVEVCHSDFGGNPSIGYQR